MRAWIASVIVEDMSSARAVAVRDAVAGDELDVARIHVRSWQTAYRGLLPDAYLDTLRPEERAQRYTFGDSDGASPRTLVVTVGSEIRGFATIAPAKVSAEVSTGELAALHVDPAFWGTGLGVALIAAARAGLVERGFHSAVLWVLTGNRRAERFYVRDGWHPDGERRSEVVWKARVEEVRYGRRLP
jgi:GNAT superfamily N-acetyltransferase